MLLSTKTLMTVLLALLACFVQLPSVSACYNYYCGYYYWYYYYYGNNGGYIYDYGYGVSWYYYTVPIIIVVIIGASIAGWYFRRRAMMAIIAQQQQQLQQQQQQQQQPTVVVQTTAYPQATAQAYPAQPVATQPVTATVVAQPQHVK